jgi:hypothetical protein
MGKDYDLMSTPDEEVANALWRAAPGDPGHKLDT